MQVLVWANMVVVKGKMFDHILQLCTRFNMQFVGEAFERSEKSFDLAVLPGAMRHRELMTNFHYRHGDLEQARGEAGLIVAANKSWDAKGSNQRANNFNDADGQFVAHRNQHQTSARAMIHGAEQRMDCAGVVGDMGEVNAPCCAWFNFMRLAFIQLTAQLHHLVAMFFEDVGHRCFANGLTRFHAVTGVERGGNGSIAGVAHDGGKRDHFINDPHRFLFGLPVFFIRCLSRSVFGFSPWKCHAAGMASFALTPLSAHQANRKQDEQQSPASPVKAGVFNCHLAPPVARPSNAVKSTRRAAILKLGALFLCFNVIMHWSNSNCFSAGFSGPRPIVGETATAKANAKAQVAANHPWWSASGPTSMSGVRAHWRLLWSSPRRALLPTVTDYDKIGRVLSVKNALNQSMRYTYDKNGNALTITDARNNVTAQTFDASNHLIRKDEPENKVTAYVVDGLGHVLSESASGFGGTRTMQHEYNHPLYAMTRTIRTNSNAGNLVDVMTFDNNGNEISHTDARNLVTTKTYDAFDRVLTISEPLGKTTTITYDANGNKTSVSVRTGRSASINNIGNPKNANDNVGRVYGEAVHRLSTTAATSAGELAHPGLPDRAQAKNTSPSTVGSAPWPNKSQGEGASFALSLSKGELKSNDTQTRTMEYDANNREVAMTDAVGARSTKTYDAKGNVLTQTNARNARISTTYDSRDRKLSVSGPEVGQRTNYTYDTENNVLTESYANGRVVSNVYDQLNRKIETNDSLGLIAKQGFDTNGNISSTTDANGRVTSN
jgi:YD repeat-containing protein